MLLPTVVSPLFFCFLRKSCHIVLDETKVIYPKYSKWMKIHSKLNKFRMKKILDCYIVSDLRFSLEIQAILPETSPFLSGCAEQLFSNVL